MKKIILMLKEGRGVLQKVIFDEEEGGGSGIFSPSM